MFHQIYPKPNQMIHLAAFSGSMHFNQLYPSKTFEDNIRIGLNVFSAWQITTSGSKAINVIPSCAYPDLPVLTESDLWSGPCNITIESHGLARRCIEAYTRQLNKEGNNIITCVVNNSFGPHDSFDVHKTKVVGALIAKFVKAVDENLKEVTCFGTGKPLREFIYCKDVAKCLLQAMDTYDDKFEPLNITSGHEISIKDLAEKIAAITGFTGDIIWTGPQDDGQNQKKLSTDKMSKYIDIEFTPINTALKETIDWYKDNKNAWNNN